MTLLKNNPQNELYELICKDVSLFNFFIEKAVDGLFYCDIPDSEQFWMDRKLYQSLGYTSTEKTLNPNGTAERYISREGLENLKLKIKESKVKKQPEFQLKIKFKHSSGSRIWMDGHCKFLFNDAGIPIKLIGGVKVIKNKELALVEQLERYAHIIEGTNIGLWEWNIQTGETIFHRQWATVLGYKLEELEPASEEVWKKLSHPDDKEKCDKLLNKHLKGLTDFYECECRMKHKNGDWVWVEDKGKVVTWTADGKPEWMTGYHEEITETKEKLFLKKSFIENAPSAIAMFDKEMNYIAVSHRWLEDYNITNLDVIGKNHYEIFPEISERWKELHKRCLKGEILKEEEDYFVREGGSEICINWELRPWYQENNQIAGLIMHTADVSHAKKLEKIAEERQHFLETILKNINVGIISCDSQGKLTLFNKATREWHGLPTIDIPPSEYSNYYGLYKADGKTPMEIQEIPLLKALKMGQVSNEEMVIKPKNGPSKSVTVTGAQLKDDNNKVTGAVVAMHDITERKLAEEILKNTIAKMEAILGASTRTMIIGTDTTGIITFYNKGAENLMGYTKDEIVGKQNPSIFHVKEEVMEVAKELASNSNKIFQGFEIFKELVKQKQSSREWTLIKKDGSRFPVQITITAIRENNEIVGYLGVGTDISELKRVETELKSILKITQSQNDRLKNFAHIVSHNLRSHSGNIEMLLKLFLEENPESKDDEMMLHLNKASSNLKETISHLNEVVQMNTSVKESLTSLCLSKYIGNAIENLSALAEKQNVQIQDEVSKKVTVLGIPAYLDSILLNFISNAIKYRSRKRQSFIKLKVSKIPNYVVLEIQDNGLGIDLKTHRRKLFGMYKTFHSNKDARGIGLFITKNQIESMGGKIEVESELDQGTTFKIYFRNEKN